LRALLSLLLLTVLALPALCADSLTLATGGHTDYQIVLPAVATPPQQHAGEELAEFLGQITGAAFPVLPEQAWTGGPALFVGLSTAARTASPTATRQGLGHDGLAIETAGRNVLLYGGEPRGTLYAVYTFLEDHLDCHWWTATASYIPKKADLAIPPISYRHVPVLEYREPFFWEAFDGDWAVRNKANGASERLSPEHGGHIIYQGFVHTLAGLVPSDKYFSIHPEWFAMRDGKRTTGYTQYCLTNQELKDFVVRRVLEELRANPTANIVSVSQNDNGDYCQCPVCAALDAKEGSHAGSLLHFVNYVARAVKTEFPYVAVDTLAYQYTQKPPKYVKPDPNVIVRLCSGVCDTARPLTHPMNREFYRDLVGWNKICHRLYVWDYVTNFAHYLRPQPNVFVLGPNVRTFVEHGVRGLFEQGSYQSTGGDMAPLKAWLLAKMLWDPSRDPDALIREFLNGYYGPAGPFIYEYLQVLHQDAAASPLHLGLGAEVATAWPSYRAMVRANALFARAFQAVAGQPELESRLRLARVAVLYTWLYHPALQVQAQRMGYQWFPGNDPLAATWELGRICFEHNVTRVNENHAFDGAAFAEPRQAAVLPPGFDQPGVVDVQDYACRNRMEGRYAYAKDPTASDGWVVVLPGDQSDQAETQVHLRLLGGRGLTAAQRYRCYAVVKCELIGSQGDAFGVAFYDQATHDDQMHRTIPVSQIRSGEWQTHELGTITLREHPELGHFWIGMVDNGANVKSVAVDRFLLVPVK